VQPEQRIDLKPGVQMEALLGNRQNRHHQAQMPQEQQQQAELC